MSNNHRLSTTSSLDDDRDEILFQIIEDDEFNSSDSNSDTDKYNDFDKQKIKQIMEYLFTNPNPDEIDVPISQSISSYCMVKDPVSLKMRPPKLWEFLQLLLNNPRYNDCIRWVDESKGIFKLLDPAQVMSLWEKVKRRKTKTAMDFDSFSRGIRCYYKSGIMVKTHIKHTYRFA